ncbi:siderophore-interacting protein [Salipiger sp. 1_MG-2023]|uniref:siderophore-interacting protein n=1 Tax=Salipiger sp. 1_MG-2023 TaxID=3062665 RepID=UPI0026E2810D|nr:siderophore-interacting protein [Salipiger sp. 1_MG-2023]MDO6586973.1 siderophore-interacting protein [Salipiger sp. 1_MG-2023]
MPDVIARTDLIGADFARLRQGALAQAAEHGLTIAQDDKTGIRVDTYYGRIGFAPLDGGARAEIFAPHAGHLQVLKDALVAQIGAGFPKIAQRIRWNDAPQKGQLPANVNVMTVASVAPLRGGFLRVTLRGDVSRFSDDAIHFRLAIGPQGRPMQWPTVGANGATQWPQGADKLHLPVYTARSVNHDAGTLCLDLFEHEGGRATQWASTVPIGSEVLVTNPGGGGCRISGEISGFADETGFPAVARILEANPDLTGRFTLYPGQEAAAHYPFPDHAGVEIAFAAPGTQAMMADAARAAICERCPPFLWFVAERNQASQVRAEWRKAGHAVRGAYISAYWQWLEE